MALKIVTGGTTGAADGTLVSSGNPLVIVALNTAVDAHIRCDDGYWSNDQDFDVPAELEVSFDAGSTWYGNADEPITAPEIYAVNVPIKIRQTTAAASTSGSFVTDGTYTAIAALSTPTLTATVISSTQIDLSWTNVANEDASPGYTIERSPDGSSWSALTTKAANVTTHSDTGLTAGTAYYYRVKAEGSGRYSDSGWGTDDATTLGRIAWSSEALLYQINEGSGTNIDDKNTSSNKDGTLTLGAGGSWSATGSPFGDPCIDVAVGYITVPAWGAGAAPSQGAAGTYEFLVYIDDPTTANIQMLLYDGFQYFGVNTDGKLVFYTVKSGPTPRQLDGATVLPAATWLHLAVAWDASNSYVYVNGVQDGTMAYSGECADTSAITTNIAGRSSYTPQGFDGKMAMARLWTSKRSEAQLLAAKQQLLG